MIFNTRPVNCLCNIIIGVLVTAINYSGIVVLITPLCVLTPVHMLRAETTYVVFTLLMLQLYNSNALIK